MQILDEAFLMKALGIRFEDAGFGMEFWDAEFAESGLGRTVWETEFGIQVWNMGFLMKVLDAGLGMQGSKATELWKCKTLVNTMGEGICDWTEN